MHSLWYDLRSQSMFEPALREAVTLIDRTLGCCGLTGHGSARS